MSYYNTSKGPLLMNFKIIPYIHSNYNELLHMMIKLYKDKIQQQSISLDKIQKILNTILFVYNSTKFYFLNNIGK